MRRSPSWRDADLIVVDLETTGLDARSDEIVSFGAVPVRGGRLVAGEAVYGLVRPERELSRASIEIHGIRPQDLVGAIANEAGVAGKLIGAIQITDRFSIVEVAEDVAEQVVRALGKATLRGKKVPVRRDKAN